MGLPNYLSKIKSAGIYRFVFDKSEVPGNEAETLRLVVGYSEKGPFNTLVYIETASEFESIFGGINKKLERRGCFFHRLALQALTSGPILVINLKPFDTDAEHPEKVAAASFNVSDKVTEMMKTLGIEDIYDTTRFWHLEPEGLGQRFAQVNSTTEKYITLTSTDSVETSNTVFMRGYRPTGYNVSFKEWYSSVLNGEDIPSYLEGHELDKLEDYFAEIYVFRGEFTPEIATSEVLAKYFDVDGETVKLKDYITNAFGDKQDTLAALAADSNSNFINSYSGILLPNFQGANGGYISLDLLFNANNEFHKMMMNLNIDALYDGTISIDDLNTSGLSQVVAALNAGTSLDQIIVGGMSINAATPVISEGRYKSVTDEWAYTDAFPVTYTDPDLYAFRIATIIGGPVFDGYTMSADPCVSQIANVGDKFIYKKTTSATSGTVGTLTAVSGVHDLVIPAPEDGSSQEGRVDPEPEPAQRTRGIAKQPLYILPKVTPSQRLESVELYVPIPSSQSEYSKYSTTKLLFRCTTTPTPEGDDDKWHVMTAATTPSGSNNYFVYNSTSMERFTFRQGVEYQFALWTEVPGAYHIYTLLDSASDPETTIDLTITDPQEVVDLTFDTTIGGLFDDKLIRYNHPILATCQGLTPVLFEGYTYGLSLPTSDMLSKLNWQKAVLDTLTKYEGIRLALTNRTDSVYHYLIDTFESYVDTELKATFGVIAKEKDNCLALVNFPSMKTFKDCKYTSFTDSTGKLQTKYIADGCNKQKPAGRLFTLMSEYNGASFVSYNTPVVLSDGTIKTICPSAALVSNQFMAKYDSRLPYSIVAGPTYGRIIATGLVGPDFNFSRADLDVLEPMGVNCMVYVPRKGTYINSNQTAKQNPVTALSKINVRELVIFLQDEIENLLQSYQWEYNTQELRDTIKSKADTICEKIKNNGGVYEYLNVCDETNNTPDVIDNEMIILDTSIEPGRGAGKMVQRLYIYRTGALRAMIS